MLRLIKVIRGLRGMRRREHQSGFSAITGLLVVLAIVVISGAGWLAYQHNRTKVTNAAAGSTQSSTQQPATTTTTQPAPTVAHLTLKEWGVKLPLSDSIKDAYYIPGISGKGTDGLPNQMWIGLKSLDGNGCTATNNSGPALIFRVLPTDTDPVSGQLLTQKYPNGATVGRYYYGYEDFTTSGSNSCKAPQTTLQTVHASLANATKGTVSASAN
jgi:hypothetical protein